MEEKKELIVSSEDGDNKKLSFQKWIQGIVHYKWWVIGGTLTLGLVGALAIQFGINPISQNLRGDFVYDIATIKDENGVERYVDGTLFNCSSIVSASNLNTVKESDSDFKKINVNAIVRDSALSASKVLDENGEFVCYKISGKLKYFPTPEIGKKFLQAVVVSPKAISLASIEKYKVTSFIGSDFNDLSYSKKVFSLEQQGKTISSVFDGLETKFGQNIIGNEKGETLEQIMSDFNLANSDVSVLSNSFYANGYVDYIPGKTDQRITQIKEEAEANVKILESKQNELDVANNLFKTMQSGTFITTEEESSYAKELIILKNKITKMSSEVNQIIKDLHWAGYFLNAEKKYVFDNTDTHNACYQLATLDSDWVAKNAAFNAQLSSSAEKLESERQEATNVFKFTYKNYNNEVYILNSGYIEVSGGLSWAIGLAAGLVLGFLLTSFVAGEVEINKKRKEN